MRTIVYKDVFGKAMSWKEIFLTGTMDLPIAFYSPRERDIYALALLRSNPHMPEAVARALHIRNADHIWLWPSWLYRLHMQAQKGA